MESQFRIFWRTDCLRPAKCKRLKNIHNDWCRPARSELFLDSPPLMGLLVQPIVGMMSDRTWNRFGRRLPYLIFGATIAVVVMCLLPNAGSFQFTVASAILFWSYCPDAPRHVNQHGNAAI